MITGRNTLINALGNNSTRFIIDKASIANTAAGQYHSLFRATGQPGQGAIPGAAAVCSSALLGAMSFPNQVSPATSYGGWANIVCVNAAQTVEIHDRLVHMGGLNGTLTTAQTVGIDLSTLLGTSNLSARIGDSNYSDVQWWLEWYTDTGATAVTATVACVYNDGTTANISVSLAATRRASQMIPLNTLIPAAQAGKFLRGVTSVTLSATTGTAGSFGVTATRPRMTMPSTTPYKMEIFNWADLGFPEIYNDSCLFPLALAVTTSTGVVRGGGKICHG